MAISIGNMVFRDKEEFLTWCSDKFKNSGNMNFDKLWENLQLYYRLSAKISSSADIKISDDGKLILAKGTLLHGIRRFDENVLKSISSDGIVFEGFFGDNGSTMTKGEACFFEVDREQTMHDYYMSYNSDVEAEQIGESVYYRTNSETQKLARLRKESGYLPREEIYWKDRKEPNSVAFIINPTIDIQPLLSQKKKLQQFARGYSIPVGIPSNCISGILVSREILQDKEKLEVITRYFPDKYISTPDGELIYEPQRAETKKEEPTRIAEAMRNYKIESENPISITDAMRNYQAEPIDEFGQKLNEYLRNNPDMDVDTLSAYINGLVDEIYKEFEDTTRTEDVNARIERFNKRINTIRRNANFQRITMNGSDTGKELYGKIANLTETEFAQRIPLVMKKRSRDEITMCSQGIGLGRREIKGVTQETRGIITQEATKTNDGVSK